MKSNGISLTTTATSCLGVTRSEVSCTRSLTTSGQDRVSFPRASITADRNLARQRAAVSAEIAGNGCTARLRLTRFPFPGETQRYRVAANRR